MRKLMIILVALGLLAAAPAPTPAQAAQTWYDGSISYSSILNCVSIIQGAPYVEYGVGAYTGFRGDSSAASPAPGEIYWIHIVVYGLGNACAGQYVSPEFILPVNTTTAIDASHKIQCYATGTADPGDCPSSLASGSHGGLVVLSPDTAHARMWPLPQGKNWEWQIPVVSDRPLTSSIFGGYLTAADGNTSPTLALTQNAYVFAKNPQVTYPAPSTTSITSTGAVSKANLYSGGLGRHRVLRHRHHRWLRAVQRPDSHSGRWSVLAAVHRLEESQRHLGAAGWQDLSLALPLCGRWNHLLRR